MATNPFQRATKARSRLRLGIIGPAGAGKSWTAYAIGSRLAEHSGGRMAVIDTEYGSASLYSDRFDFDVLELTSFEPAKYIDAIRAADDAGYAALVIDSLSHAWAGPGGVLEFVDNTAKRSSSGNSYTAWRDGTKLQNQLVDTLLGSRSHLIVTMRSKQEYVQEKDSNGRTQIRKVGMQPVQREGLDYEFTITADMDTDHNFMVGKTRIPALDGRVVAKPDGRIADELWTWLNSGAEPAPRVEQPAPNPASHAPSPTVSPTNSSANGAGHGAANGRTTSAPTRSTAATPERTMPQSQATPRKERTPAEQAVITFWMSVKALGEQDRETGFVTDEGRIAKAVVHKALGLSVDDGALADWAAIKGNSYDKALAALKLGIPVATPEPAAQGELIGAGSTAYPDGR